MIECMGMLKLGQPDDITATTNAVIDKKVSAGFILTVAV